MTTDWLQIMDATKGEHVMDNSGVPDIEACAVKLAAACPDAIDWITPQN